jgi:hypothetical protein
MMDDAELSTSKWRNSRNHARLKTADLIFQSLVASTHSQLINNIFVFIGMAHITPAARTLYVLDLQLEPHGRRIVP